MATKIQFISELSSATYKKLPDYKNWTAFLRSAAWQYKYPFADQLMIYAQRPDATACANISVWNNKLHRWVNKGAKGIALPHRSGNRTYLDYVFDISDTNSFYGNDVTLWQYQTKHADAIIETLENTFGELENKTGIIGAVFSAAHNAVEDSKADYISEIKYARKDSFLEELDSINIDVEFQKTAENSVAYMILERMGIDVADYLNFDDFLYIMDFNTPATLTLLGNAVSSISEQALREIAATIRAENQKEKISQKKFAENEHMQYNEYKDKDNAVAERTDNNVREHNLQTDGRSSTPRPQTSAGEQSDRQIRENERNIPQTAQEQPIHNDAADGNAERTSGGNRQDSNRTGGENSVADGESRGSERGTQSLRPDEVDTADEQPQTFSRRNNPVGNNTQLNLFDLILPSEAQQQNIIREAERLTFGSAFSMPQQIIDEVLTSGANNRESILNICTEYSKDKSSAENVEFLKKEYGTGGKGFIFDGNNVAVWWNNDGIKIAYGDSAITSNLGELITWEKADSRIKELLELGRYAPQEILDKTSDFERSKFVSAFWYMHKDVDKEEYPELKDLFKDEWFKGGYPDSTARIAEMLNNPENITEFMSVLSTLEERYANDRKIMRFHLYSPDKVLPLLEDLQRQHITFTSNEYQTSNAARFITDDEIDNALIGSTKYNTPKIETYLYFDGHPDAKDRIKHLKERYGISGGNIGLLRDDYNGKGVSFSRGDILSPFSKVTLSWNKVERRIDRLIKEGRYLNERERTEDIHKYLSEQEQRKIHNEKYNYLHDMDKIPSEERLPTLPKRIKYFIDISETYEKNFFSKYNVENLLNENEIGIGEAIKDTEIRQKLSECMQHIGGAATDVISRNCGYKFAEELKTLQVINLHKVGDFYEVYGEEAEKAAEVLQITLTPKTIDGGQIQMTGFPAHIVEDYSKTLTENGYLVIFAEDEQEPSISDIISQMSDDEKEAHIDAVEITLDYGDGDTLSEEDIAVYDALIKERSEAEQPQQEQTVRDIYNEYAPIIVSKVLKDEHYINACHNTDKQNARLECDAAVKRAVLSFSTEEHAEIYKLYFDMPEFHKRIHEYSFEQTYDMLRESELPVFDGETEHTNEPQSEQPEDLSQYIGREITDDARKFVVDSINETLGTVSLRDVTFQNGTGFPVFRSEKIEWLKAMVEPQPEQEQTADEPLKSAQQQKPIKVANTVVYPEIPLSERNNFIITDDELGYGGAKEKFRNNMEAIRVLKECEVDNRLATPEEQEILSRYVGWGGLPDAFDESKDNWSKEFNELSATLTPEEYEKARASTLNAHYTSPTVIKAMYKALENMGFKQGNILEPSCGIGNFMGLIPDSMENSKIYGIEIDSITGRIAQQLYQKNSVAIQGYEDTTLPDSFFDVAVGNVPFGNYKLADKKYNKHNFFIHDYFFAKTLDKVRSGGIITFITSMGTMDKKNSAVRKYIAQRADLLGAIRLPNNAFLKNAATQVTADIIFLQKRDRMTDIMPEWVNVGEDENGYTINQYFIDNPDMILGEMAEETSPYGKSITCKPYEDSDLAEQLNDAIQNIHAQITEYEFDDISDEETPSIPADPNVRNFSYTVVDGDIYFRENSIMNKVELNATAINRIKGLVEIRDCVRQLIEYQTEDYPDDTIKQQQAKLNILYDKFSKKYGLINSRANSLAFSEDSSYFLLCSLEVLNENGELERKADIFTKRTIGAKQEITKVDTSSEALAVSLSEKAKVDMDFMMSLTGKSEEDIVSDLENVIFLNPIADGLYEEKYLTADEYLSGNVREKLRTAQAYAQTDDVFRVNVEALTAVQPKDLTAAEISVRLGAAWIPDKYIEQFTYELLDTPLSAQRQINVRYSKLTGEWNVSKKSSDFSNVKANHTYGTHRANAYKIIEETLNLKDVRIYDYVDNGNGGKTPVLNTKETAIAQQKQESIKQAFLNWIWKDPERRETLVRLYNEVFNSNRPREYDGSHITFNGMNPEIELRQHQKNAVARIMYGGNSLLGHTVGAGKTWTMVAAAMESKRLGLCNKSLFVVPNHLTEQWASEFLQLYPAANILVATKKDFEMKNRKKFCGRIATGDYDAVIIGHSQFEKIPMSQERQTKILQMQLDEIVDGIIEAKANKAERITIKQLEKSKRNLEAKLKKLNDQSRKDDVVTFEELGIDRVFVDEAHYYKNLYTYTKMRNVGGIAQTEAQKSSDLFMKSRYLDEITGGKGLIFATGTPISNSMVELYTMQRYLQYGTLDENNLHHFDAWASTFGETVTSIELAPEGTGYRAKTRFARFYNLPELMSMFKEIADIQTADMLNLPVPETEYHTIAVDATDIQKEFVADCGERAEKVRNNQVDPTKDNMLKITNDGRKIALDQRMENPLLPDDENSKVNQCIKTVFDIWEQHKDTKATQLVFCDMSTPKNDGTFNVYDDIRKKLIEKGIPENEIEFIHNADTEVKKKTLFSKVRKGDVRILLGSTSKMGAGTNVQKRLIASHDLDCPWRPADLEQRSGRIIRQGNDNDKVHIYRYVTKGTFDSYMWQTVENKQKFISQVYTSKSPARSAEDIDATALSYAEIKALSTDNPYIKEKMELDTEVSKLKLIKSSFMSEKYALEDKVLKHYPKQIAELTQRIQGYEKDIV